MQAASTVGLVTHPLKSKRINSITDGKNLPTLILVIDTTTEILICINTNGCIHILCVFVLKTYFLIQPILGVCRAHFISLLNIEVGKKHKEAFFFPLPLLFGMA